MTDAEKERLTDSLGAFYRIELAAKCLSSDNLLQAVDREPLAANLHRDIGAIRLLLTDNERLRDSVVRLNQELDTKREEMQ